MVDLSVQDSDTFKSEYHRRSIIEAMFGAIKKMYGNHTRCHKPENQCREIAIRIICYNIELVARSKARDGRLTEDDRHHDCMTGAASTAPAQRSLRIVPWNGGNFMVSR